jgi:transposase-like protein
MTQEPLQSMLKGDIEVDETYIGGKPRRNPKNKRGRGTKKSIVLTMVEREGNVVSRPIERVSSKQLKGAIQEMVHKQSTIHTDEWPSYRGIGESFEGGHKVVNHSKKEYVNDEGGSTNTAESYFALLKRGVNGIFHHVSKQHLERYCNEFNFRWNHRKITDKERTVVALQEIPGKYLTYKRVTGKLPIH